MGQVVDLAAARLHRRRANAHYDAAARARASNLPTLEAVALKAAEYEDGLAEKLAPRDATCAVCAGTDAEGCEFCPV